MDNVKVKRDDLLAVLRTNREKHRETFERACVGYKRAAVAALEQGLEDARAGKRIMRGLALVEPIDQTREYDRAIKMLEMSVDEHFELSEPEFAKYVCDDWNWKQQFTTSTQSYL